MIVGTVIGVLAALILLGSFLYLCFRKRRERSLVDLIGDDSTHRVETPPPPFPFEEVSEKASYSSTLCDKSASWVSGPHRKEKGESYRSTLPPSMYGYGVGLSPTSEIWKPDPNQITGYAYIPDSAQNELPLRIPRRSAATRSSRHTYRTGTTLYDGRAPEVFQLESLVK